MNKTTQLIPLLSTLFFTACAPIIPNILDTKDTNTQKAIVFKTNQVHFMNTLKETSSMTERNVYLDEYILKSDIQCQNYLNNPLKKPEVDNNKNSLYMNLFDTVSSLFGVSLVTDTAKAVFLENNVESQDEKKAYANALSPEIRKGVELGRSRYAKSMLNKKSLDLKAYTINNLREDTLKYDKQCSDTYGLIEINRALKEMQTAMHTPSIKTSPISNINPTTIKDKVEAVSKEVERKHSEHNATVAPATQPVPVDVPVRHDNAQHLPHSIQL